MYMRDKSLNKHLPIDYVVNIGKEKFIVETMYLYRSNTILTRMQAFMDRFNEDLTGTKQVVIDNVNYKVFGKYKVKETFAGEESLTELLTQYVERSVSMNY